MRVIIQENYDKMCTWAAKHIAEAINAKKEGKFVLGLPTGSSPLGVYAKLIEMNKAGEVSFENVQFLRSSGRYEEREHQYIKRHD